MSKSIMLVNVEELYHEAIKQGYQVDQLDKGHEASRESLNYFDAERLARYDIVILEAGPEKAEELRIKMLSYTQKETVIARFTWKSFWCDTGGYYQVKTIDECFNGIEIFPANLPNFEALKAAIEKHKSLGEITLKREKNQF